MKNYFYLLFILLPLVVFAQNPLTFIDEYCKSGTTDSISYCLQGLYNLGVAIAVVLAFFMFFVGAFKNLISVIPDVKMEGKTMMRNSIIGLVVIFLAGSVLYWINPFIFDPRIVIYRINKINLNVVIFDRQLNNLQGNVYDIDEREFAQHFPKLKKAIQEARIDLSKLPNNATIKIFIETAFIYANSNSGRESYMKKYGNNTTSLTACNLFVFRVLKETEAIPTGTCPSVSASEFHNLLLSTAMQNYAKTKNFMWQKLPFNINSLQPGDILVKTRLSRGGHGHVAIVVPILDKNNKPMLVIAHASLGTSPPRLTPIPENFQIIVRPTPINSP